MGQSPSTLRRPISLSEQKTFLSTGLLNESGPHRETAVSDTYLEWRLTQRAARPFKVTAGLSLVFFKPRPLSRSIRSGFGSPHPGPLALAAIFDGTFKFACGFIGVAK